MEKIKWIYNNHKGLFWTVVVFILLGLGLGIRDMVI